MFSKPISEKVALPSKQWVQANVQWVSVRGVLHVLVEEANGLPAIKTLAPRKANVVVGRRCSDALHDTWKVEGPDKRDLLTRKKMYIA